MPQETTKLTPIEEELFKRWVAEQNITDVDHPASRYDYRGYWKEGKEQRKQYPDGPHFPDTYKQHGHPTFSIESKYSSGPWDGGRWVGESFIPQGADFLVNSRGQSKLPPADLIKALTRRP